VILSRVGPPNQPVGLAILAKRTLKITSRPELARRCGLSVSQLQRSIRGTNKPNLEHAFAIAHALETTVDQLFIVKYHRSRISPL
jgi:transcriptional regulator with XRE-family HTH domain